jgi:hypothetical protein
MTQPTPTWSPQSEDELKRFLERGANTTLKVERTFAARPASVATPEPVDIQVPGTEGMADLVTAASAREAHVTLLFKYSEQPDFMAHIFVNSSGNAPTETGFVGAVAFFAHHPGPGETRFRLPATVPIKATKRQAASVVRVVPVAYPNQKLRPHTMEVTVALELVQSTATRNI